MDESEGGYFAIDISRAVTGNLSEEACPCLLLWELFPYFGGCANHAKRRQTGGQGPQNSTHITKISSLNRTDTYTHEFHLRKTTKGEFG